MKMAIGTRLQQQTTSHNQSFEGALQSARDVNRQLDVLAHRIEALRKEEARRYEIMMDEEARRHEQLLELIRSRFVHAREKEIAVQDPKEEKELIPTPIPLEKRVSSLTNSVFDQTAVVKEVEQKHLEVLQMEDSNGHDVKLSISANRPEGLLRVATQPSPTKPNPNVDTCNIEHPGSERSKLRDNIVPWHIRANQDKELPPTTHRLQRIEEEQDVLKLALVYIPSTQLEHTTVTAGNVAHYSEKDANYNLAVRTSTGEQKRLQGLCFKGGEEFFSGRQCKHRIFNTLKATKGVDKGIEPEAEKGETYRKLQVAVDDEEARSVGKCEAKLEQVCAGLSREETFKSYLDLTSQVENDESEAFPQGPDNNPLPQQPWLDQSHHQHQQHKLWKRSIGCGVDHHCRHPVLRPNPSLKVATRIGANPGLEQLLATPQSSLQPTKSPRLHSAMDATQIGLLRIGCYLDWVVMKSGLLQSGKAQAAKQEIAKYKDKPPWKEIAADRWERNDPQQQIKEESVTGRTELSVYALCEENLHETIKIREEPTNHTLINSIASGSLYSSFSFRSAGSTKFESTIAAPLIVITANGHKVLRKYFNSQFSGKRPCHQFLADRRVLRFEAPELVPGTDWLKTYHQVLLDPRQNKMKLHGIEEGVFHGPVTTSKRIKQGAQRIGVHHLLIIFGEGAKNLHTDDRLVWDLVKKNKELGAELWMPHPCSRFLAYEQDKLQGSDVSDCNFHNANYVHSVMIKGNSFLRLVEGQVHSENGEDQVAGELEGKTSCSLIIARMDIKGVAYKKWCDGLYRREISKECSAPKKKTNGEQNEATWKGNGVIKVLGKILKLAISQIGLYHISVQASLVARRLRLPDGPKGEPPPQQEPPSMRPSRDDRRVWPRIGNNRPWGRKKTEQRFKYGLKEATCREKKSYLGSNWVLPNPVRALHEFHP